MIRTNYHTHSHWCDGQGGIGDYIAEAQKRNFLALGFSGHAPLPFPNEWTMSEESLPAYIADVQTAKQAYEGEIEIYLGIEADYIKELIHPSAPWLQSLGFDYTIGSVHMLQNPKNHRCYSIDGSEEELQELLDDAFGGDPKALVQAYYRALEEMASGGGFEITGHFDLIRKLNGRMDLFDENETWYREAAESALDAVAKAGLAMEVNTGALSRGYCSDPYPSESLMPAVAARKIPMVINSDAHRSEWIDFAFDQAREKLLRAGYRSTLQLLDGRWQEVLL